MAHGHVAGQGLELALVEDLGYQAHVAHGHDVAALADGDPGGLLPAVLQRVEGEVGQARDLALGRVYAEDATFVARSVAVV